MPFTLPTAPIVGQVIRTGTDVYTWNGTRWTLAGTTSSSILGQWINAGPITVGATTTASTKPATRLIDMVRYREVGFKTYEIEYKYAQIVQGSGGNGEYLFSLPAGLQFDTTIYPLYTGVSSAHGIVSYSIANARANMHFYGNNHVDALIIPWSATQFRVWVYQDLVAARQTVSNTAYGFNTIANCTYNFSMNITVA